MDGEFHAYTPLHPLQCLQLFEILSQTDPSNH